MTRRDAPSAPNCPESARLPSNPVESGRHAPKPGATGIGDDHGEARGVTSQVGEGRPRLLVVDELRLTSLVDAYLSLRAL